MSKALPQLPGFTVLQLVSLNVQTHTRTASLKERKEQLIVSIEEVKSVQAAKRILSELGSEEKVGV